MARAKTTKKAAARISKKSDALIVELSLQNPDFGAKRLVPLLKQKKVSVSSSQIYGVLKRHDLQTREKRLARIEKPAPQKAKPPPAKSSTKISDETAEQIVEISLQNPEFGSKRLLPLLQESGIDASTSKVYSILKRRGLQTCDLRRSRMELERLTDGAPPDFETEAPKGALVFLPGRLVLAGPGWIPRVPRISYGAQFQAVQASAGGDRRCQT